MTQLSQEGDFGNEEVDLVIAEKDSRIEGLCDEIQDAQGLRKELDRAYNLMQELRDRSAAEQERFERRVTQLEEKQENVSEWFNSQVQELDMNL